MIEKSVSHRQLVKLPVPHITSRGTVESVYTVIVFLRPRDWHGGWIIALVNVQVEAAADRMCAALPSAEAPLSSPAALYNGMGGTQSMATQALGRPGTDGSQAALPAEVAEMAAAWAQLLVMGPSSGSAANFGLAGIAACLLVVSCPR